MGKLDKEKEHSVNDFINHGGVCRAAPGFNRVGLSMYNKYQLLLISDENCDERNKRYNLRENRNLRSFVGNTNFSVLLGYNNSVFIGAKGILFETSCPLFKTKLLMFDKYDYIVL